MIDVKFLATVLKRRFSVPRAANAIPVIAPRMTLIIGDRANGRCGAQPQHDRVFSQRGERPHQEMRAIKKRAHMPLAFAAITANFMIAVQTLENASGVRFCTVRKNRSVNQ